MKKAVVREFAKATALYLPSAAMIGAVGYLRAVNKNFARPEKLVAQGNLSL